MRQFLQIFIICLFVIPTTSLASDDHKGSIEDAAKEIMASISKEEYTKAEDKFDYYRKNNTKNRHGTDMVLAVLNEMLYTVEREQDFPDWKIKAENWTRHSKDHFIAGFFERQLKHYEALSFQNNEKQWNRLQKSLQRKYRAILNSSYTFFYKLNNRHPDEWRGHAFLVKNFEQFKLTREEINEHFEKSKAIKPFSLENMTGYIRSLSAYELGRTDKAIKEGIETVLKRYPDRNLSKPQYLTPEITKEIEDAIFEVMIYHLYNETVRIIQENSNEKVTQYLIPVAYTKIDQDLKHYFRNEPQRAENHPLSINQPKAKKEIKAAYKRLRKSFPDSTNYDN